MKLSNADARPESVSRHGGKIVIARNITEKVTTDDDGNETISYDYERYTLPDGYVGDPAAFLLRRYSDVRQVVLLAKWPLTAQQEAWDESEFEDDSTKLDEFKAFKTALKLEYPKPE